MVIQHLKKHTLEIVYSNVFCLFFRDVKVKAGEWFFEERAKKYPGEGNYRMVYGLFQQCVVLT